MPPIFMETIESKIINDYLKLQAHVPLKDDPLFRLVWSEDARELRIGTFRIYIAGVFIREEKRAEHCLKYSWIKERWILEQWYPPEIALSPELPDSINGSYEPIFVFEDKFGRSLPLNKKVVELIIYHVMKPSRSSMARRSAKIAAEEEKDRKELDYLIDAIDTSPMLSQLHHGEALIVPASYAIKPPNLRSKS